MPDERKHKRQILRDKLWKRYNDLVGSEGKKRGEALDVIMDEQIKVKEVYTIETIVQLLFNERYSKPQLRLKKYREDGNMADQKGKRG